MAAAVDAASPSSDRPFTDAQHGWYATGSGRTATIYATTDGGRTWAVQSTLTGDVVSLTALDATHAWLSGNRGFLAATTDGSSWHRISSPTSNFVQSLQFRDRTDGWLTDATGRLYTTADGGPGRYLASITSTPGGDEWVVGLAAYRYANGA